MSETPNKEEVEVIENLRWLLDRHKYEHDWTTDLVKAIDNLIAIRIASALNKETPND